MRRRELLALTAGGLVASAGCLGDGGPSSENGGDGGPDNSGTATPTQTSTPTETPGRKRTESVTVDSLQPGLVELDGNGYAPREDTRALWRSYNDALGDKYGESDSGWLLFELPATAEDPTSARLTWPGGSWQPGSAVRTRLATPTPSFRKAGDIGAGDTTTLKFDWLGGETQRDVEFVPESSG